MWFITKGILAKYLLYWSSLSSDEYYNNHRTSNKRYNNSLDQASDIKVAGKRVGSIIRETKISLQ